MNPSGAQPHFFAAAVLALAATLGFVGLACNGCHGAEKPPNGAPSVDAGSAQADNAGPPTVRLYLISDLAGALEPCGCTKDQLGGMDHLASWIGAQKSRAPSFATLAAGPTFFMDATLTGEKADQEKTKAETIAKALKTLDLLAFAPAENDWAAGKERLETYAKESGAALLLANAGGAWTGTALREINGVKVGLVGVGVAAPAADGGAVASAPPAVTESVRAGVDALKKQGAEVLVALASIGRGDAKRLADAVPELTAILVGSTRAAGEANTQAPAADRVGNVIIAQAANHLQSVAVLDLYVRDHSFQFADATGIEREQKRADLTRRIDDLHVKIANWERDKNIPRGDLDARKADLERLQKERDALDVAPPPTSGSFFRYTVKEIRTTLGADKTVQDEMLAYYKAVNEHNKVAFADRMPQPHTPDQATYVGAAACGNCHKNALKFWQSTQHAHAYKTLQDQFKEYNLDCVSCHVTGYELPGGSTVTHVDRLTDVQCEVCHGPGSKHGAKPEEQGLIIAHPKPDTCLSCHHPPHVEQFDPSVKMNQILGPGHGKPMQ